MYRVVVYDDNKQFIDRYGIKLKETANRRKRELMDRYGIVPDNIKIEPYSRSMYRIVYEPSYNIFVNEYLFFHRLPFDDLTWAITYIQTRLPKLKTSRIKIVPNRTDAKFKWNHREQRSVLVNPSQGERIEIHLDCESNKPKYERSNLFVLTSKGDCLLFQNEVDKIRYMIEHDAQFTVQQEFKRLSGGGLRNKDLKFNVVSSSGHFVDSSNRWRNGQSDFTTFEMRSDRLNQKYSESETVLNPYLRYTGGGNTLPKVSKKKDIGCSSIALQSMRDSNRVLESGQVYKLAKDLYFNNPLLGFVELRKYVKSLITFDRKDKKGEIKPYCPISNSELKGIIRRIVG